MTNASDSDRDAGRQACADEIELTPEMLKEMDEFFWEWRAENADAVIHYDAPADIESLFRGLYGIQIRLSRSRADARKVV